MRDYDYKLRTKDTSIFSFFNKSCENKRIPKNTNLNDSTNEQLALSPITEHSFNIQSSQDSEISSNYKSADSSRIIKEKRSNRKVTFDSNHPKANKELPQSANSSNQQKKNSSSSIRSNDGDAVTPQRKKKSSTEKLPPANSRNSLPNDNSSRNSLPNDNSSQPQQPQFLKSPVTGNDKSNCPNAKTKTKNTSDSYKDIISTTINDLQEFELQMDNNHIDEINDNIENIINRSSNVQRNFNVHSRLTNDQISQLNDTIYRKNNSQNRFHSNTVLTSIPTNVIQQVNYINTRRRNYFVDGITHSTSILDISPDKMGTLIGLTNSHKYIDNKLLPKIVKIFNKYLLHFIESVKTWGPKHKESIIHLNKYKLLPTLLFTIKVTSKLKGVIKLLEENNWNQFTVGYINIQKFVPSFLYEKSNTIKELEIVRRIKNYKINNLIESGSYKKAYKTATNKQIKNNLSTEQIIESLQNLHPSLNTMNHSNEEKSNAFTSIDFSTNAPITIPSHNNNSNNNSNTSDNNNNNNNNNNFSQTSTNNDNIKLPEKKRITIDIQQLFRYYRGKPNDIQSSFDKKRYEHEKQLCGTRQAFQTPEQKLYLELQAQFLEIIINDEYPTECKPWFHDSHLLAIPKTPVKPRPIGMRSIDQRTATHFILAPLYVELREMFHNIQFGLDKLGTEKIIHTVRHLIKKDKKFDLFIMDGENAFNTLSRIELLNQIKQQFPELPELFNFFHSYLADISNMWFMNKDSPISPIQSREGVVQGDVAGSSLYSLGIHPLALDVRKTLTEGNDKSNYGLNLLLIDDHTMIAHFEKMKEGISKIMKNGPRYGYYLNKCKGTYLMSECSTLQEANERKKQLIDLGLDPKIIMIHPNNLLSVRNNNNNSSLNNDNYNNNSTTTNNNNSNISNSNNNDNDTTNNNDINNISNDKYNEINNCENHQDNICNDSNNCDPYLNSNNYNDDSYYGAKLLGSYIGTDSYIKKQLKDKMFELNEDKNSLIDNVGSFQNRLLLLRQCYDWKINHLFRTLPPILTNDISKQFQNFQKDILKSVLFTDPQNTNLPNNSWLQALLKFEDAGLNIQNVSLVKLSGYAASVTQCLPSIIDNLNFISTDNEISIKDIFLPENFSPISTTSINNQFKHYYQCISEIEKCDPKFNPSYFLTTLINDNKIQKILTDALYDYTYKQNINIIKENDQKINVMNGYDISRCANYVTSIGETNCYAFKAAPKFSTYQIKNNEYQSMLLRRLFLPQPFIPDNMDCTCASKSLVDQFGIHASSCLAGGEKKRTSKNIELTLKGICEYSGCRTRYQDQNSISKTSPNNHNNQYGNNNNYNNRRNNNNNDRDESNNNNNNNNNKSKGLIPDLSVYDSPQYPNEILEIDCSVVQSFPGSNNPLNPSYLKLKLTQNYFTKIIDNVDHHCRESHRAELAKINKYNESALNCDHKFLPFIMENNGYINKDGIKFLQSLAKKASIIHSIPENNLLKYFKTLLSISLQRSISQQIITHTARINTPFHNPDKIDMTYQNIMEYDQNFN